METSTMLMVAGNAHDISQHDITFIITQDKGEHIANNWKLHSSCHNGTLICRQNSGHKQSSFFNQHLLVLAKPQRLIWLGYFLYPGWAPLFHTNEIIATSNSNDMTIEVGAIWSEPVICWTMRIWASTCTEYRWFIDFIDLDLAHLERPNFESTMLV